MIRGKHIIISLLVIGILWLNWFIYSTFKLISNHELTGDEGRVAFCVFLIVVESLILLGIIICNLKKLWDWEFNLNKWICKLKHW